MAMKKGQGAMEYLMTYGWALLVIVVVGAALYALGVLNPSTYQQKRCYGFQYFSYVDHMLNTTDFVIHLRNGANDISIDSVKVGSASTDTSVTVSDPDIQEGDEFTILVDNIPSVSQGNNYDDLDIVIQYDVTGGIANNKDRGTCVGKVQ